MGDHMGIEMNIREVKMSRRSFIDEVLNKRTYTMKFDDIEELTDFIKSKGNNGIIEVRPDGIYLLVIDPSKDLY